jgi:hypothetical protein
MMTASLDTIFGQGFIKRHSREVIQTQKYIGGEVNTPLPILGRKK